MIPEFTRKLLLRLRDRIVADREPDLFVGGREDPYMHRWFVIPRNPLFNIYLHQFVRSDDPRALHDHPWKNRSLILEGAYLEVLPSDPDEPAGETVKVYRVAGQLVGREARAAHRVELIRHPWTGKELPVWTLFFTGPRFRRWGFYCPKGWKDSADYIQITGKENTIGAGCGE